MENIIEGKIEYESKKYGFYYLNNILTLIPDDSLDSIWDTFFKTLKERTIDDTLVLEGITSSGYRITFINLKLVKQAGGIYKAFVPAYIIGNSNAISPLPQIDKFDSMIFIDKFFDPQKIINTEFNDNKDIKINFNVLDNNEIEIEGDLFYFGINKNISRGKKNPNTPLMIKSYLEIKFKNRKNIEDVIEYYRKVCGLFKFLYNRKYVKFSEIKLISKGKIKDDEIIRNVENTFDLYCYVEDEEKLDLPDSLNCLQYKQIEGNIKDLYLIVNMKDTYKNYYSLNKNDELKITINKYSNISSAFESWFDINFPNYKSNADENYKRLKNKVIDFIDNSIKEEKTIQNKEILHWFKSDIEKMEGSLKEQIKYTLNLFKDCITNTKKNLIENYGINYSSDNELNEQIANNFKNTRNKISHGNMKDEILFSDIDIIAYAIVEKIVRCLVLYKAKVNIEKIKEIVDDKF